ncbi:hypothetical protein TRL7639_03275 [Falsiruegeria litorea R37]|uniref:DUF3467 domain-containing protein n=1 Tax=Falsiruegeria litorea R37 TaxID=1200284 RepID=A0A1Y5T9L2_9RHOB|nr:hypothetical protein [Falsiruegeria litorea]SLN58985.1 hypothetical protein TRL7639_03275 [Falsiruegeria litorea R37]
MDDNTKKPDYVADYSVRETFGDAVVSLVYDGANFRLEIGVSRMDQTGQGGNTMHPVARVIMPMPCANDLRNKLTGLFEQLENQGVLKRGNQEGAKLQ